MGATVESTPVVWKILTKEHPVSENRPST